CVVPADILPYQTVSASRTPDGGSVNAPRQGVQLLPVAEARDCLPQCFGIGGEAGSDPRQRPCGLFEAFNTAQAAAGRADHLPAARQHGPRVASRQPMAKLDTLLMLDDLAARDLCSFNDHTLADEVADAEILEIRGGRHHHGQSGAVADNGHGLLLRYRPVDGLRVVPYTQRLDIPEDRKLGGRHGVPVTACRMRTGTDLAAGTW